jgi:hypothetical protein
MIAAMHIETGVLANGQPYKLCPTCRQPAVFEIAVCRRCGFRFPMTSGAALPPPVRTAIQLTGSAARRAPGTRRDMTAVVGVLLVLAVVGWVVLMPRSNPNPAARSSARPAGALGGGLMSAAGIPADQVNQRLLTAGANTGGDLEVSLAWNSYTDLDLQLGEPSGDRVDARNQHSRGGGDQDVDMNPTLLTPEGSLMAEREQPPGAGAVLPLTPEHMGASKQMEGIQEMMRQYGMTGNRAPSRFSTTPVEHIYYTRAARGTYTVFVSCYSWREPNAGPLAFTIDGRSHGKTLFHGSGSIGPRNWCADGAPPVAVYRFNM